MTRYRSVLFVVLMLFGIGIVMQFRTVMDKDTGSGPSARELAQRLDGERTEGARLLETLSKLEADYAERLRQIGENQGSGEFSSLLEARNQAFFQAGLTRVKGSGIVMTLNDAVTPGDMAIEDYIIHDSDIIPLLNELRIAGAEAVSINGERILGMTKTICAGPTILINSSRYPVPFEFKAIGDPQRLYDAMENSESVAVLRIYDIRVDIRTEPELVIEKYRSYGALGDLTAGLEVVVQ